MLITLPQLLDIGSLSHIVTNVRNRDFGKMRGDNTMNMMYVLLPYYSGRQLTHSKVIV